MKQLKNLLLFLTILLLCSCFGENQLQKQTFHLYFDPNGGEMPMDESNIWTIQGGETICLPTPIKEGKTFTGWNSSHGHVLNPYQYLVTSDETFTAIYNAYDVIYLNRDHSIYEIKTFDSTEPFTRNEKVLPSEVTTDAYYRFTGWADEDIPNKLSQDYLVSSNWERKSYDQATFSLEAWLADSDDYDYNVYLKEDTLIGDNYETAYLAMCLAFAANYRSDINELYRELLFDNYYYSPDYYVASTPTTSSYTLAHKRLASGLDLINISIQGSYPTIEWVNNFTIGESGPATGYLYHANRIKNTLYSYLESYEASNVIVLINGYSRGGGIAQVLSYLLNSDVDCPLNNNQHLTITLEAPRPIDISSSEVVNCINYYMNGDIVASVSPYQLGLYHYGIERAISDNPEAFIGLVDDSIIIPKFSPNPEVYTTQDEYLDFIWSILTSNEYDEAVGFCSREAYCAYSEETLNYFVKLDAYASYRTITRIESTITNMGIEEIKRTLIDGAKLKDLLYPILSSDARLDIDEAKLTQTLNQFAKFMKEGPGIRLLTMFVLNPDNIRRCVVYHYPELIFAYIYSKYLEETNYINK